MAGKFRIGIFGCGRGMFAAQHIADHFSDDAVVAALCDRRTDQLDRAKAAFPDAKAFDSFDDFIDSGLDAVVLANYFHEHAPYAIRAMEKGIAVLSETTAAVTHRDCVRLVETAERTGTKYALAENYPFSAACLEMKRVYETGTLGKVMYAEGEYCHPSSIEEIRNLDPEEFHWRKYAPMTYYITHSLGPLIYMTGQLPRSVTARTCYDEGRAERIGRKYSDVAAIMLISTDSDAVFRVPACAMFAPHGNWYRLSCTDGGIETVRGDEGMVRLTYVPWNLPAGEETEKFYRPEWKSDNESAAKAGHGGGDYWVVRDFIEYLKGNQGPDFDVYKATTMAATAIQAWRSVLNGNASYPVPDFRNKADRLAYANDNLTPFVDDEGKGATLPQDSRMR